MLRPTLLAVLLSAAVPTMVLAQTSEDLKNDEKSTADVLVYGMGYSAQRYSPLTQINKQNVSRLVPVWGYSLADLQGGESFPIVKDGVIYITTHNSTAAVDALTGKQIWRTLHDYPPETLRVVCCGIVNRGAAMYEGLIIRALMDNRMIALDAKTGKEIWHVKSPDPVTHENGYAMTGAPLIVNGIVITGVAGAEFSHRGLLEAYDAKTGKHLWRTYTVPAKGEPGSETWEGDSALTGGGSSWVTGTYDAEFDLVYWGIGNPAPWNPRARKGDNLYTNSVIAIRPSTGKMVWYFQTTPHDPFDYDGVQTPVIATLNVGGSPRKVIIQANRSGFLYVLDAKDGKLIASNAYDKVNWASGIDKETGRPIVTDVFKGALEGKNVTVWPSISGVTNWQSPAFSPQTGLLYVNTLHVGMTYEAPEPPKLEPGKPSGTPTVKQSEYSRLPQGG
jgi:alcohol dehydrogenase (cytochrome c)